ncbi:MAG: hypothetical protein BWZ02_00725 [Lentisphaerae bacterium ADurb.BinA184]|nr:MAG: hypothetical protein BWZ02_00725 [Lentisphaerae bacterium ADurb.BinA184]
MKTTRVPAVLCGIVLGIAALAEEAMPPAWPMPPGIPMFPPGVRTPDVKQGEMVLPCQVCKVTVEDAARAPGEPAVLAAVRVAFSPDGRLLAVGTAAGEVRLVDVYANRERWKAAAVLDALDTVDFSNDGKSVCVAGSTAELAVVCLDAETGAVRWKTAIEPLTAAAAAHLRARLLPLPGGELLFAAESASSLSGPLVRLAADGSVRWRQPAAPGAGVPLLASAVTPDGGRILLLTGGGAERPDGPFPRNAFCIVDPASGKVTGKVAVEAVALQASPQTAPVRPRIAFAGDGTAGCLLLPDGTLRRFATDKPLELKPVPNAPPRTTGVAVLPGGRLCAVSDDAVTGLGPDDTRLWSLQDGRCFAGPWASAEGRWVTACATDRAEDNKARPSSGMLLLAPDWEGEAAAKIAFLYRLEGHVGPVGAMAADGSAFVVVEMGVAKPKAGEASAAPQIHVHVVR